METSPFLSRRKSAFRRGLPLLLAFSFTAFAGEPASDRCHLDFAMLVQRKALVAFPDPGFQPPNLDEFPALTATYAPYRSLKGVRGPEGWRSLSPAQREEANRAAVENNMKFSRTLSFGRSTKDFVQSASEVKEQGRENVLSLYRKIVDWADRGVDSPESLEALLKEANATVTNQLNSIRKRNGEISVPGQLRDFLSGREAAKGLKPEDMDARFHELSRKLFTLYRSMERGVLDPVEAAGRAYLLYDEVKPFFDGNGRTEMALMYFFLERAKYPLPTVIGNAKIDPATMKHHDLITHAMGDPAQFVAFLQQSVKETQRNALKDMDLEAVALGGDRTLIGEGVQGSVHLLRNETGAEEVEKTAKSVAATEMLKREDEVTRIWTTLPAKERKHVAKVTFMSEDGTRMRKEFIRGPTGQEILNEGNRLNAQQVDELRKLYAVVMAFEEKYHIYLDLKPKNVIWSQERGTWVFVDLGPKFLPLEELATFDGLMKLFSPHARLLLPRKNGVLALGYNARARVKESSV
jgi:Fic/DOC family